MSGFYVHNGDETYWAYFLIADASKTDGVGVARMLCHDDGEGTFVTGIAEETSSLRVVKAVSDCIGEIIGPSSVVREKWLSRRNIVHCYPEDEYMTIERSPLASRKRFKLDA